MRALIAEDLMTLERYSRERMDFRARVLAHKAVRKVAVGPDVTWLFEDRLTVQYQVQEMLRVERIFEPVDIEQELAAYNPLIPDGSNLKATMLIEIPDVQLRPLRLAQMKGIEDCCYLQVAGSERVFAIADEDLERANDTKTSAVHFLRFEFTPGMVAALRNGAALAAGVDHAQYQHRVESLPVATRAALINDLE
jgi:Protein of unknown function (DUF3501)